MSSKQLIWGIAAIVLVVLVGASVYLVSKNGGLVPNTTNMAANNTIANNTVGIGLPELGTGLTNLLGGFLLNNNASSSTSSGTSSDKAVADIIAGIAPESHMQGCELFWSDESPALFAEWKNAILATHKGITVPDQPLWICPITNQVVASALLIPAGAANLNDNLRQRIMWFDANKKLVKETPAMHIAPTVWDRVLLVIEGI